MKRCGRLDPFSVITYHLGLFFSPFSLAATSKRMGTLEGEASSELNLERTWCVILVLVCDATRGQSVGWLYAAPMRGYIFPVSHPHKCILKNAQMFVPTTVWRLFSSLLLHSCCQPLCSTACSYGHLWPTVIRPIRADLCKTCRWHNRRDQWWLVSTLFVVNAVL